MRRTCNGTLGLLFAICVALPANAEERAGEPATNPANATQTGKERLGRKWMDEQRIDNCNVPINKRGSRPRPADCPRGPAS